MTRILVVDDEPQILRALRINLRVRDYEVHVAATGAEALEVAGRVPPGHLQCLGSGGRDVYLVVAHPQVDPQRPQDLRLVVDDQDPRHPGPPSTSSRSRWPGSGS